MSLNIKIKIKKFSDLVVLVNVYICTAIVRIYFNSTVRRKDWSMFGYFRTKVLKIMQIKFHCSLSNAHRSHNSQWSTCPWRAPRIGINRAIFFWNLSENEASEVSRCKVT